MRLPLLLLASAVLAFGQAPAAHNPHYGPVKSLSPEEFQRELGNSKHYDFELASGGLVDAQGTYIKAADLSAYLRERHLDPGAYFLLQITQSTPPLNTIAPTIAPLGQFGATKIVVRHKDGGQPRPITGEFKPAPGTASTSPRINVIQIRPNHASLVAGQPWPDLSARAAALRPGPLPPRVRYAFGPDAAMASAAAALTAHLLHGDAAAGPLWASRVSVPYGAWHTLRHTPGLGKTGALPFGAMMRGADGKPIRLDGILLTNAAEVATLERTLVQSIAADGGGRVHALTTEEMARWWPYVGFDYVEPILALTTNDGAHTYAFLIEHDRVELVDDLAGLPGQKKG